jgi:glycerophosphoryl diester phosphodiesterase
MKIIGHRGARGLAPENTLAAIKKGIDHKADLIEFDLRVTSDHVAVLHHNRHVITADGHKFNISENTYAKLKEAKSDLATFDEVLDKFGKKATLYIEVKRGVDTKPIVKLLKRHINEGGDPAKILLGSKNQKVLVELHKAFPEIKKVVIEPWSGVRAHIRAYQVKTNIVSMNQLWLWSYFIRSVSRSGFELYAYTLNDPKKAKRWEKHGLKGVVTDFPDRFEK